MGDDITIGVTEIVNNIEVTAQPNDQVIDIEVIDNSDDVTLNVTPNVIEVNINKGSSYARWGSIFGNLTDQTDLTNALFNKADLVDGKVPAYQLPSFVDDVIEVANFAALPTVGEIGKIYVTLDNNKIYRWSGSVYIEIAAENAVWGQIVGTLSNQTDLQSALNAKVPYTGATANVDLGTHTLSSYNLVVNHASGSGVAAQITKGGNGEALTVVKSSGTGNAASITGGITLLSTLNLTNALADAYIASAATWNAKQNALNGTGFVKISGTTISYDNNTYALDNAVVHLTGAETITGKKTFDSSEGSADAIEVISNSTGYGVKVSHPSGGTAIFIDNPVGVGLNVNNTGTNSFGISISNPSTGRAISITNGGAGSGINLSNNGSGNGIYLNNPATGTSFYSNNTSTGQGILSINSSTGIGIQSANSSTGKGFYSENAAAGIGIDSVNSSTGTGIRSVNSSTGIGIYSNNTSSGKNLVLNNTTSATGMSFTIQKNITDVFTINDAGEATGVKFIKSGGTSSQFLKADGSVDSSTYALTSDVVTLATDQTISGQKTFLNNVNIDAGINIDDAFGLYWKTNVGAIETALAGIGQSSSGLNFFTGSSLSTPKMVINSSGNLGLGVTPSAWGAAFKAVQIGSRTSVFTESDLASVISNNYVFTDTRRYLASDFATSYQQVFGEHRWQIAPSGTAGNAISFTQAMTLDASGRLGIGTTNPISQLHLYKASSDVSIALQKGSNYGYVVNDGTNIGLASDVGSTGYKFLVNRAAPDNAMSITSSGNVGIGTTSPSNLLEAVGSTFAQIRASNFATIGVNRGGGFRATSTTNGGTSFLGDFNAISNNGNAPYNGVDGVYLGSRTSGFPLGFTVNNAGTEILALNILSTGAATFSSSVTATSYITSSDKRLKNIISRDGDLAVYNLLDSEEIHYGYIAQDMQEKYPNQVHENDEGFLSLNYIEILVKKVNDLEKQIEILKNK